MKLHHNNNEVDSANVVSTSGFTVDGAKFINLILSNTYKDPVMATVRELAQNASEVANTFHVHMPTDIEPWLSIKDDGIGMSKEDTIKYSSGLGSSTKDGDNTAVGGFGIGMKVPFSMTDQYLIISRYEGWKYTFTAYKDEMDVPQFALMSEQETDEPNGFEVRVPVEQKDFSSMHTSIIKALRYFNPKPTMNVDVEWEDDEYTKTGDGWGLLTPDLNRWNNNRSKIVMGNLWYPIDNDQIRETYRDKYDKVLDQGVILDFPIGSLPLPISREDILYNDHSIQLIRDKLDNLVSVFEAELQQDIDNQPNLWDAVLFINNVSSLYRGLGIKLENLSWQGKHDIPNHTMVRVPYFTKVYDIPKHRWQYKSLSLQGYICAYHSVYQESTDTYYKYHTFTSKPVEDMVIMVVDESSKKKPSRLLRWINEKGYEHKSVLLFEASEGGMSKQQIVEHLYELFEWTDIIDFDVTVPDYKIERSVVKKTAKVFTLRESQTYWNNSDRDWWKDAGELDLDKHEGVYVDTRNYSPTGHQVYSPSQVREIINLLIKQGYLPDGVKVYGCPGSHKNKMKDHHRYISIDECINLAKEIAEELKAAGDVKYKRYEEVRRVNTALDNIFSLDINVEGCYYNSVKRVNDKFNDTVRNSQGYRDYVVTNDILNSLDITREYTHKETEIKNNRVYQLLKKKYPLLGYIRDNTVVSKEIEEYINLKENCNV